MAKPTTGRGPGAATGSGPFAPEPGMETLARPLCRERGMGPRAGARSEGLLPDRKAAALVDINGARNGPLEL